MFRGSVKGTGYPYVSAVVMLDTTCSEVVWRLLATHSIRQFPLHFPSRASPCAITFQLESTNHGEKEPYPPVNKFHSLNYLPEFVSCFVNGQFSMEQVLTERNYRRWIQSRVLTVEPWLLYPRLQWAAWQALPFMAQLVVTCSTKSCGDYTQHPVPLSAKVRQLVPSDLDERQNLFSCPQNIGRPINTTSTFTTRSKTWRQGNIKMFS
jgi:hypothetical protein